MRKLEIAQKESNETETWLSVLYKIGTIDEFAFKSLRNKCGKIGWMLIALSQQLNQNLTEKSNFAQNPKVQFAARMLHNNLQQHQSQLVFCKVGFFVAFLNSKWQFVAKNLEKTTNFLKMGIDIGCFQW